jgi:glycosyltransferase involved in cell wall biosynthesis
VVHVCPSEAEGFGHLLGEAMSCGALVVTTDAPPMNELVDPERGVLVRVARSEPLRYSSRYFVDLEDLELQLARVFAMGEEQLRSIGLKARAWYDNQSRQFESSLRALLDEALRARRRQ